jgi:hypothetical protein
MKKSALVSVDPTRPAASRIFWFGALGLVLCGCAADLQNASSGKIGCAPQQITIENDEVGWASRTWTAACNGKQYFCSAAGKDISCTAAAGEDQTRNPSSRSGSGRRADPG